MTIKIKKISSKLGDLIVECFYSTVHSRRIKIGIIKSRIRRISEYYANGDMSKEDFDKLKKELQLKLDNL